MDLRRQHPDKLRELIEAFDAAAWANMVYPLDNRTPLQKFNELPPHQQPPAGGRRRFLPNAQTVHRSVITPADRRPKLQDHDTLPPGLCRPRRALCDRRHHRRARALYPGWPATAYL